MAAWDAFLTEADRKMIGRGKWGQSIGPGSRPAVILIDVQNYMVGERGKPDGHYPLSCGEAGWKAIDATKRIVAAARRIGAPIVYTRFVLDPARGEGGAFTKKLGSASGDLAFLAGTHGAEIVPEVKPEAGDLVFDKKKMSSFFGTPLAAYLVDRGVDTIIVTGGSTSNCVRATVVDAFQMNYRVLVPEEAVFDRIAVSHAAALLDIQRLYGDVVTTEEVVAYLGRLANSHRQAAE